MRQLQSGGVRGQIELWTVNFENTCILCLRFMACIAGSFTESKTADFHMVIPRLF